ncbi:unnamed protein product [Closterium sp. NIES-64]|nr:unnamed protein product [Closterium sp. NIES-64]
MLAFCASPSFPTPASLSLPPLMAATPFQKGGKLSENGRGVLEWPRVSPPLLALLNALLLALVVVEVWPQFAGDGPTWGTRGTWGVQQPIEALLGSPGVARGRNDANSPHPSPMCAFCPHFSPMCAFRPIPSPWCAFRPCLPHVRIPPPSLPYVRIPPPSLPHVLIPPPSLLRVRIPPPSLPHVRIPPPSLPLVRIPPPSLPHVRIPPPSFPLVRIPTPSLPHVRIPPPSFSHVRIQEPVVTSSIRPQAATGEAAAATTTGGVVVDGRGCSRCVRGEQCSFHVWVRPPARWVLPPVAPASSEQENGAEGGNKGEGESSSGSSMEPSWWKKDVTLSLLGPALGHGEVQCLDPPACSHLRISYRLWDAGTYSATLHVGCANLNFSPAFAAHFNSTYRHDLATWSLSIGWPESVSQKVPGSAGAPAKAVDAAAGDSDESAVSGADDAGDSGDSGDAAYSRPADASDSGAAAAADVDDGGDSAARSSSEGRVLLDDVAAGDEALGEGDTTSADTAYPNATPPDAASPSKLPSPCALSSIPGRWTKARSGKYIWAFFPCAPAASPPSRWIEQLASRGIREINIVGDSHQRVLALHLHWLLSGEADKRIRKGHLDFSKESRNERNETMRINFYWVDGIYRNDEFGCSHRGIYTHRNTTFPTNVSTTADVTLLEAGYWMNKWCTEPVQAMRAHLPEYLNWGLQFAAQTGKPIVLRTAPPVPNGGDHCFVGSYPGPATNLALMEINRLMRQLTAGGKVYGGGANGLGKKRADSANETGYSEADVDPAEPWDDASISRAFTVDEMRQVSTVPVFDSWKIEAPRYMDVCPKKDHHYSCYREFANRKAEIRGPVGEAVARALVHFLLHTL